ncbi:hypothetical protein SAMN05421595_0822 [Austwickia chelonae]|nr:hypothetical protein SAMN05421595_0822 [Austwickia chelonae]
MIIRHDEGVSPSLQHMHPPLVQCAIETERYVAGAGWDQPVRLFALVDTAKLVAAEPALAHQLKNLDDQALSAIEQEDLPPADPLEDFLAMLAWPADVDGVAMAVERLVVPPDAEADLPEDPDEAAQILAEHPDRVDVRLLVAVTRDGESTCLLRQRPHDSDDKVAIGQDIAPELVAALAATLQV